MDRQRMVPRLDKYDALLRRLFEILILSDIVKKVHESHSIASHDYSSITGVRRRFLKNLAFICDYDKGGPSTSTVAVEERVDCCVIWVSSNEGAGPSVVSFLESVLSHLRNISSSSGETKLEQEAALAKNCSSFASKRIWKEWNLLTRSAKKCWGFLDGNSDTDTGLRAWLGGFTVRSRQQPLAVCQKAYEARDPVSMQRVEEYCRESDDGDVNNEIAQSFRMVRHFVGRLASRIRAVTQLIDDAYRLRTFLTDNNLRVESVPLPRGVKVPSADAHTNIRSILRRLMPADASDYEALCDCLNTLDISCGLSAGILSRHAGGNRALKPRVHSEVQMADHFHEGGRRFWNDDPFIGSSKPACLCCKLYMKYHPIDFIPPDSHNKVHPNWCPALLPDGRKDARWVEHRNNLISMIHDISHPVLQQIRTLSTSGTYQADSLTQITQFEDDSLAQHGSDESEFSEGGHGNVNDSGFSDFDFEVTAEVQAQAASCIESQLEKWDSDTDTEADGGASLED